MTLKKSSGILVTFSGLPYTTSNFFLDNGMANLAGALVSEGHDIVIMDYNTPEVYEFVFDNDVKNGLNSVWELYDIGNVESRSKAYQVYHKVQSVIDDAFEQYSHKIFKELEQLVESRNADYVGFKLWLGRGVSSVIYVGERLKKRFPGLKIYGGGPAGTLFYEQIFSMTDVFDAITVGEGEGTICYLAEHAVGGRELSSVPNLVYKENGVVKTTPKKTMYSLDELPTPSYDISIYPAAHNTNQKIKVVTMDESRGCNRRCAFCIHNVVGGRPVRTMCAERVVNEFSKCMEVLGTHVFNLGGSSVPTHLLEEITRLNKERGLDVLFNCFTNAEDINPENLVQLREGGLFSMFFGLESLDHRVLLEDYKKSPNTDLAMEVVKKALDAGIYITGSMIYPSPRENFKSSYRSLKGLTELFSNRPNGTVVVFYPGLMPQTIWSEDLGKFNIVCDDLNAHYNDLISCEIRHFLPPSFWQTFNYRMNGRSQAELAQLSDMFARALLRRGVTINAMGDSAMLAFALNRSPEEFGQNLKKMFLVGDAAGLRDLNAEVNKAICRKPPKTPREWIKG